MVMSDVLTGSRNIGVRACAMKKYAIWHLFLAESPKFLHLIGNLGRETRR